MVASFQCLANCRCPVSCAFGPLGRFSISSQKRDIKISRETKCVHSIMCDVERYAQVEADIGVGTHVADVLVS